jgi:cell wall-associated NlpC family hydrolase
MPPQRLYRLSPYLPSALINRGLKFIIVATTVVLAGCAANTPSKTASSHHLLRDSYLSHTQADPLGAYLRAQDHGQYGSSSGDAPRSLASAALGALGVKYRFGGDTPSTGFDCSGLVSYAAEKSLGLKLPRKSSEMARLGKSVDRNELKKGDLVFFNTRGHRFSHVGIYLGDRKFVHAPRAGSVVRIESMDIAYWKKRYNGARRLPAGGVPEPRLAAK